MLVDRGKNQEYNESEYKLNCINDRENAILWSIIAARALPFTKKLIRVHDGLTFHDGSVSWNYREINDSAEFIKKYLNTEVYLIIITGTYNVSASVFLFIWIIGQFRFMYHRITQN